MARAPKSFRDESIDRLKRLAVIALFSDDQLVDTLVLKGGNALALIHGLPVRASFDLDFSIPHAFPREELGSLRTRIEYRLNQAFRPEGYEAFDVRIEERPAEVTLDLADFWGGYSLEFKIVDRATFTRLGGDLVAIRRNSVPLGPDHRRRFEIDISKHEYCDGKQAVELDGYTVYAYTPDMIVCEKLRALCQQTRQYLAMVKKRHAAPRGRDLLDIFNIVTEFEIDPVSPQFRRLLSDVFAAKRVALVLLRELHHYGDFHRSDWPQVKDAVAVGHELREFEFYFDYVNRFVERLEIPGDV